MVDNEKPIVKHIADIVGEWGDWQRHLSIYIFILWAASALNNMGYSFHTYNVEFWCSDVPIDYTFDLVCDRTNLASLTQSFFMLGYLVSGLVFAYYSDKYGRRPLVWVSFTLEISAIISCSLSINIKQYLISQFFLGIGNSGKWLAMSTIQCCGPKYRSDIYTLTNVGWVLGYVSLPGLAFWLRDFRHLQLLSALLLIVMMIWFYFFYESPRWQLTNGQIDGAEITLRKALKKNGKSDQNLKTMLIQMTNFIEKGKTSEELEKKVSIIDLFKTPKLRKYTLILWYLYIVNALVYYGISFNMSDFGGNFYVTFLLSGLVELPSNLISALLLRHIPRRKLFSTFLIIITVSSLAVISSTNSTLKVIFALIGKFAVTSSFCVMAIFGPEIFPTVLRHTGYGSSSAAGRIGSIAAPFMKNLAANTSLSVVMIFYALLTALAAVLVLVLPETKGREIPDTLDEAESAGYHPIKVKHLNGKS